jgi:hypothetical protein
MYRQEFSEQEIRTRIDKWNCIKLKSFCTSKEKITWMKRQPAEWKKVFSTLFTGVWIKD